MPHPLVRRVSALALFLACLVFLPVARLAAQPQPAAAAPAQKSVRVLFIGNSYTYYNNLPAIVKQLAGRLQPARDVEYARVLVGGATLMSHYKKGEALRLLRESRWDYVVLQEQSTLGNTMIDGEAVITDPNRYFWPYVREFDREIKKAGAKTVLLQTWARRTRPQHFDTLTHAYMTIGRELHALVIPAGSAWQRALAARADLPLYIEDGSHPGQAGSYLTALSVLSALFDAQPPEALPLKLSGPKTDDDGQEAAGVETIAEIDAPTLALFRRVAWETWRDVKQKGGYLDVKPTADRTMAPLGQGLAIAPGALAGTWRGALRLYSPQSGAPQTIAFTLSPAGGGYTGTLVSDTPNGLAPGRALRDVTIEGGRLSFTVTSGQGQAEGPPVRYTAVLSSANELDGRAEMAIPDMALTMRGSWNAKRD